MRANWLALILLLTPTAVTAAEGDVATFAGRLRDYGDGGSALQAAFNEPHGVATAPDGSVFVADTGNRKIRWIDPSGTVTTLATGLAAYRALYHDGFVYIPWGRVSVPGGTVTGTSFDITLAASDDADLYRLVGNSLVKVTNFTLGTGTTLTTLPEAGGWRHLAAAGGTLFAFGENGTYAYSLSGGETVQLSTMPWSELVYPRAYASDGIYLYATESFPFPYAPDDPADNVHRIRKISLADGAVSDFLGGGQGDRTGTGTEAAFSFAQGLSLRGDALFVADMYNHKIKRAGTADGDVTTVAGEGLGLDGVSRLDATLNNPLNVTGDSDGNLYIAEVGGQRILKVSPAGIVTTLAGSGLAGDLDASVGTAARFRYPCHVAVQGNFLYVADFGTHKIRRIHKASGEVSTLAGFGIAGFADGSLAEARFAFPWGIFARDGRIYVADTGNHVIREIDLALGRVRTVAGKPGTAAFADGVGEAARFNGPRGLAVNGDSVYVADSNNAVIRKLDLATMEVTTVAGIPNSPGYKDDPDANMVRFYQPWGISFDQNNVYVADTGNNRVRKVVQATGETTTLAGTGVIGDDDGPGASATLNFPHGLYARQTQGRLFIADTFNNKIRVAEIPVTNPPAPPPAIADLSATAVEGLKIDLSWAKPLANAGVGAIKVYMSTEGASFDFFAPTATLAGDASGWTASGLSDGVTYRFIVRASNADLEEHNTNEASATAFEALSCPMASIKNPHNGKKVSGNSLQIMAEVEGGSPLDVLFQYRALLGSTTDWVSVAATNINHPNPDPSFPYFVHWNPEAFANGEYQLRALAKCPSEGYPGTAPSVSIQIEHADPDVKEEKNGSKNTKTAKVDKNKDNTVGASHPDSGVSGTVEVPGDALQASSDTLTVDAEVPAGGAAAAAERELSPDILLTLDISLKSGQTQLAPPAKITFTYDKNAVAAAGTAVADLTVIYFNPATDKWEAVPSSIDETASKVYASVSHFSLFGLGSLKPAASNLAGVRVYPVPFVPNDGDANTGTAASGITFDQMTDEVEISVYDVTGRRVWKNQSAGTAGAVNWDTRNSDGRETASGVYFAVIRGGGETITRKIAIVR